MNKRGVGLEKMTKEQQVLKRFVDTIIATGGLVRFPDGTLGCAGDEDWLDLADAAALAAEVLNTTGIEVEVPITDLNDEPEVHE